MNIFYIVIQVLIQVKIVFGEFTFTIYHTGDIHANFDQDSKGIGGIGRILTYIKNERALSAEPSIYLDAGDICTGSIWFSVHRLRIAAEFVKLLKVDAMGIGNHEFDEGVHELEKYFKEVKLPLVCANANFSQERDLGVYVKPSIILTVEGVKIGVIGYLNQQVGLLSPIGKIKMKSELIAIKREIKKLQEKHVNIIIGLGHSGYDVDQKLARMIEDLDIIVGGHTHTFLYSGESPLSTLIPKGDYPTIVKNPAGVKVPIVHAYAFAKFVGKLMVTFDDKGNLQNFSGNPILLDKSIEPDPSAINILNKYRPGIEALKLQVLGQSRTHLSGKCRYEECNLANVLMDSIVNFKSNVYVGPYWTDVAIAFINGGSIRRSISPDPIDGNITVADIYGAIPFDNILVTLEINGSILLDAVEYSVKLDGNTSQGEFLQFSGLHVIYDLKKKPLHRVQSIKVRCAACNVPTYEPLNTSKIYKIVVNHYLATGGDGYAMLHNGANKIESEPIIDSDTLKDYIKFYKIIQAQTEERIIVKNQKKVVFMVPDGKQSVYNCFEIIRHISLMLFLIAIHFNTNR